MSFRWTDQAVREALGLPAGEAGSGYEFSRVSTDSRTVEEGDLFLAISGERFDGNDFVGDALDKGAAGVVVSKAIGPVEDARVYAVSDTLHALGRLANHRRMAMGARVVGITGSSGKTSTKDLMREALRGSVRVHATQGNFNNRIGLPLTLLAAPDDAEVLILEMGTNEPGEIAALTEVAAPDMGVITTVSETHLEKLGTLEGVLEEKLDLFRGLSNQGLCLVGDEPPALEQRAREVTANLLTVGWSERAAPEHRPEDAEVTEDGCFRFRWMGIPVELRMPGRHSVQNALLALAVAHALGVPPRAAAHGVGRAEPGSMRSQVMAVGGLTLLVDCYNANPQSLHAALDLLITMDRSGSRVAVLGSMLELGPETGALHMKALEDALSFPLDLIVATGLFAEAARKVTPGAGPELVVAPDMDRARDVLLGSLEGGEVVLLKASRGVAMEVLIPSLEDRFGSGRAA